jgi:hypothetical protein
MSTIKSDKRSFSPDEFCSELHSVLLHDLSTRFPSTVVSGDHTFPRNEVFLDGLLKKYKPEADENAQARFSDTVQIFMDNCDRLDHIQSSLQPILSECKQLLRDKSMSLSDKPLHRILITARQIIGDFCVSNPVDLEELYKSIRSNAGASLGIKYTDTSPRAKWTFPITVTRNALPILAEAILDDAILSEALDKMNVKNPRSIFRLCQGSKHFVAPKTAKIDRNCGKEPTGNMMLMLAIMDQMVRGLKEHDLFGLDLSKLPEHHNQLAKQASVDLMRATLDGKNASDSILLVLVEFLFSANRASYNWLWLLKSCRSESMQVAGQWRQLPMISTMGNAYTFPLETMFFYALALATLHVRKTPGSRSVLVDKELAPLISVFGDDVICPSEIAEDLIHIYKICGVEINLEKSFYGNYPFRESCGTDFFAGRDVRPFYIKSIPQGLDGHKAWLYNIFNGLVKRIHCVYGLPYKEILSLPAVLYIRDILYQENDGYVNIVPSHFPDSSGIQMLPLGLNYLCDYFSTLVEIFVDVDDLAVFPVLRQSFDYKKRKRYDLLSYSLALRQGPTCKSVPDLVKETELSIKPKWLFEQEAMEASLFEYTTAPERETKIRKNAMWSVSYGYSSGLDAKVAPETAVNVILVSRVSLEAIPSVRGRASKGSLSKLAGKQVGPTVVQY